jgi:hypothetical protein
MAKAKKITKKKKRKYVKTDVYWKLTTKQRSALRAKKATARKAAKKKKK